MRRLRRFGFGPVSLLAMSIILPPASEAANLAVTLFTDTNSGGLAGTGAGAAGDLRAAILEANALAGADTITFACGSPPCTITLTGPLPPITDSLTIDGGTLGNIVVSGANAYRVFFVDTGTVTIRNLVIQNGLAQGGAGGTGDGGGGGGAGLGAGLFVNQAGANVSLTNVRFLNSSAVGGAGGTYFGTCCGGGGGGGMAFPGGATFVNGGGTGGGGMLGPGGNAPSVNGGAGGAGGGGGGGRHNAGTAGAGSTGYATNTGGAAGVLAAGGAGGFGGGGGGAPVGVGGNGGFGGGGGGTGASIRAGNGGPGGGGGGADGGTSANSGSGGSLGSGVSGGNAGTGSGSGGGGGAAAGPAVFVNAGSLTISNSTAIGSTATPGAGGTGLSGHNGSAGTSNATSLFNYAGMVNSSTATGPLELLEPPTVTSVSPGSGPTSGGNTVTITGTNFTGAISVMFEGTAATSFTVASATTITAIVPAHAAGSVNVVVTTPGGSNPANTLYTYNKLASAISVTAPGSLTYGASGNAMASVSGSTGAVTFTAAGGGCSVSGATVSVTNASLPCNLTATVAADNYYNGASSAAFSVTLNKAISTISVTAPGSLTYGSPAAATASVTGSTATVTFSTGSSTGCSVSGATVSVTDASGSCNLTATVAADNNHNGASSAAFSVTLNKATSTISVTGPGTLAYGASGTAIASVTGSTATVTFSAGSSTGCSVSGATVSVTNASLPCNLTATVAADNNYNAAASAAFSVTLNKAALTVTAQNATKVFGAPLPTFTPTITGFINGDTQAVVTGAPILTTTATATSPVNTYPITATVGTLAAANYTFTTFVNGALSITKASTTTQLATQSGSLVATITPVSPGTGSPTGTVQFLNDATVFATVPLSGPTASTPAPRSGMMTAIYSGDAAFTGSNSAALVIYPPLATSLSLTSDPRPSTIGSVVIFTALISTTGGAPGAGAAITGTVQFFDGSSLLGTANVSNNQASFSTAALSAGSHLITARYTGSAPNAEEAITQTVNTLATRMTLAANPINAMYGQPVTLRANVGPTTAPPGFAPPSGPVTFLQESGTLMGQGTPLGTVNLVSGTATFTVNNLSVGTHYLAAKYGGDSTWAARSSEVVVTVAPASTVTSVSLALVGGQLVLTGVTAPVAPAAGTPTGDVNFVDQANNTTVASGVLSGGKAAASMATSAASTLLGRPIAAVYAGDTNFQSSTSASLPVVVNAASDLPSSLAADEICSIFGVTGMQGDTAATLTLTASLGGVTVTLTDSAGTSRPAHLYGAFASARQINFLAPGGLANGMATLSIALPGGGTQSTVVNIANTSPGIFAASMNGQGVYAGQAAYVHSDDTQTVASSTNPVNLGTPGDRVYLILYGTGLRQAAAGSVMMNGASVPVTYFGAQGSYAGVDQINVGPLPASLAGAGTINLVVAADGVAANPVTVTIQ